MSEPACLNGARERCHPRESGRPQRDWTLLTAAALLLLLQTLVLPILGTARGAQAAEQTLVIEGGAAERRFTAAELLARPDAVVLNVTGDVYHRTVAYRAVPLLALLGNHPDDRFDAVEAQASDGFVAQIPLALIAKGASGGAVAFIAVEDPAHPWPALPQKTETAGPFYWIWKDPEKSGVSREQWPYQLVRLSFVESPIRRWPQLAAPASLPADASARRGQVVFVTQCLPCHQLNGGGASDTGPDLGRPMSPTHYLTEAGLRAIIRNPQAVRTWPEQRMIGFGASTLPDTDLDALIAYLRAMAPSNQ
jgi:mono/diheme cytochrome c family protein